MERVCESRTFCRSARLIDFLRFTVTETLAGRQADLKEYAIGTQVYGRGTDFDPKADSIVRSEAARLRMKLDEYYANEGKNNPTRIKYVKGGYAPLFEDGTLRSGATAVKPSTLAVLPFVNTSGLAENECFSDGLTDELISALTAVPNLRVIARTTVFQFKGKTLDIREIGRRINADVVVEGTVRTAGERIRITAQLIDIGTGAHV